MDEKLKAALMNGETVKWTGRPEASKLLEKPFGTRLYITWAIAAVVLIVSCVLLMPTVVTSDIYRVECIALLIAVNFAPVMLSFQPIFDLKRLENKTLYANINRVWLIPKNAEKPADARKKLMKN